MTNTKDPVKDILTPIKAMLEIIYGNQKDRKTWKIYLFYTALTIISIINYVGAFIYIYYNLNNLIKLGHTLGTVFSHIQVIII